MYYYKDASEGLNNFDDSFDPVQKTGCIDHIRLFKIFHEKLFLFIMKISDDTKKVAKHKDITPDEDDSIATLCKRIEQKKFNIYNNEDLLFDEFLVYLKDIKAKNIERGYRESENEIMDKFLVSKIGKKWDIDSL